MVFFRQDEVKIARAACLSIAGVKKQKPHEGDRKSISMIFRHPFYILYGMYPGVFCKKNPSSLRECMVMESGHTVIHLQ